MIIDGRIGRFVKAARLLLMVQLGAAALALLLSVWAFLAVRDLAAQRDRLQTRVAELEAARTSPDPAAVPPGAPTGPELDANLQAPPPLLTVPMPILIGETNTILPGEPPPESNQAVEPPAGTGTTTTPAPEADCTGANANQGRCRPGRWTRRDPAVRPPRPTAPEPQRPGNQQTPPGTP
ncbi:MAG TPA: hypothetical protein VGB54_02160 [Allosphingosinicella sp.]|jgi:hypothetical protein